MLLFVLASVWHLLFLAIMRVGLWQPALLGCHLRMSLLMKLLQPYLTFDWLFPMAALLSCLKVTLSLPFQLSTKVTFSQIDRVLQSLVTVIISSLLFCFRPLLRSLDMSTLGHTRLLNEPFLTRYLEAFPTISIFLYSLRIRSGKDPPL